MRVRYLFGGLVLLDISSRLLYINILIIDYCNRCVADVLRLVFVLSTYLILASIIFRKHTHSELIHIYVTLRSLYYIYGRYLYKRYI